MSSEAMNYVVEGSLVNTDRHGYLRNHEDWSEDLAKAIARTEGIELTQDHWDVIHFLRNHYLEYSHSPNVRSLVKMLTKAWGPEKGGKARLYSLFPAGPSRQGCKIAGLPLPHDCIDW